MLEGSEAIEDKGFRWCGPRPKLFKEEQAMPAETLGRSLECAVGDSELAADLPQTRAPD